MRSIIITLDNVELFLNFSQILSVYRSLLNGMCVLIVMSN